MRSFALSVWAVLWVLTPVCSGRLTTTEKRIQDARMLARSAIIRIQQLNGRFRPSPNIEISGLNLIPAPLRDSAQENLGTVHGALSCFIESLSALQISNTGQIQADLKNLKVLVRSLATSHNCLASKCGTSRQLKNFLRRNSAFVLTIKHIVLDRLQNYLSRLLWVLDNPLSCMGPPLI
ncbi:leptin-like [Pristis pectinata]|uniref:leptin-like n=1 Tax=Pristis pectinata TaxID=685728 RepID=UPI00223E34CB|nr:leptin-like [Pristis pectinata]